MFLIKDLFGGRLPNNNIAGGNLALVNTYLPPQQQRVHLVMAKKPVKTTGGKLKKRRRKKRK